MVPQPHKGRPAAAMTFPQMPERVRYDGAYPTRERAEEAVRAVLAALGRQVVGDERVALAGCLPVEAVRVFTAEIPDVEPLTGSGFIDDLASRTGGTLATARWDACTVLAVVSPLGVVRTIT
ncbi:DUF2267 domain-containing protein [Streptomyces sp. NBC_00510]